MSKTNGVLLGLATLGMIALCVMLMMIPRESAQGFVQKIFYVHVPVAWVAFLAFGVTGFNGLRYLMTRNQRKTI